MELHDMIGTVATTLTTGAFFPQALHIMRTRDTKAISLPMYAVFTAGVGLWLIYGLMIGSWPIIAGNCVTLPLASFILIMKMKLG